MKNKNTYFKLADYLSLGKFSRAITIINDNPIELDITYDKGIFFDFAIKHNNTEMLSILLNYFEQTQLQSDIDSREHQLAKYNLRQILQDAVDSFDVSEEMQEILAPYLPEENDSNSQGDLSDTEITPFKDNTFLTFENLQKLSNIKKEDLTEFFDSIEQKQQDIGIKLNGENNSFENYHDISTDYNL